jgi:hypothetical protein
MSDSLLIEGRMSGKVSRIELEKPDELIYSPHKISVAAAYFVNAILLNEQVNAPTENKERRIAVRDVHLLLGAETSHNTIFLERVLDELLTTKVHWGQLVADNLDDRELDIDGNVAEGDVDLIATTFLQSYVYRVKSQDGQIPEKGFIRYKLSDRIFDIIKNRSVITNINVLIQRFFSFQYSQMLYELLSSIVQRQPDRPEPSEIIHLDRLRQLIGVEPGKYTEFADFRRYVLKPAVDEIAQATELSPDFKTLRRHRAVYAIEFVIGRKHQWQLPLALDERMLPDLFRRAMEEKKADQERSKVVSRLVYYGMNTAGAIKVIERLGLDKVRQIIAAAESDFKAGYRPDNKNAYVGSVRSQGSLPRVPPADRFSGPRFEHQECHHELPALPFVVDYRA